MGAGKGDSVEPTEFRREYAGNIGSRCGGFPAGGRRGCKEEAIKRAGCR